MNNISDVLLLPERFSQDPLETYFCKQHPLGARIDKLYSITMVMPTFFETKSIQAK